MIHGLIVFGVAFVVSFVVFWIIRTPARRRSTRKHEEFMRKIDVEIAKVQAYRQLLDSGFYDSPMYFTSAKDVYKMQDKKEPPA